MKKSLKYIIVLMLLIVMGGIGYMFYSKHYQAQAKYVSNRILNGQTNADETKCYSNRKARVLFGSEFVNLETSLNHINKELSEFGSEEYMDLDKLQRKQNLTDRKADLTATMGYYKDAAVRYQSDVKSGKGTKIEKQHAYVKAMKTVKLGTKMEDLQKKKKELFINANKLLMDAHTEEERKEIMANTEKQVEEIDKEWINTRDAYKKLVDSAVGTKNQVKKRN